MVENGTTATLKVLTCCCVLSCTCRCHARV